MALSDNLKKVAVAAALGATVTYVGTGLWDQNTVYTVETQPTLGTGCQPPDVICELPCAVRGETESRTCLACHDGSAGFSIHYSNSQIPSTYNFGREFENHPTDVDIFMADPAASIKPSIDYRLVLVQGRLVGCTTCHNYWAVPQQKAWVSMPAGELCLGCHDK